MRNAHYQLLYGSFRNMNPVFWFSLFSLTHGLKFVGRWAHSQFKKNKYMFLKAKFCVNLCTYILGYILYIRAVNTFLESTRHHYIIVANSWKNSRERQATAAKSCMAVLWERNTNFTIWNWDTIFVAQVQSSTIWKGCSVRPKLLLAAAPLHCEFTWN